jgi:hypothetical protein
VDPQKLELKDLHFTGSNITISAPGQQVSSSGILSVHMSAAAPLESDGKGGFKGQFEAFLHYPLLDKLYGWTVSSPKGEEDNFVPFTEKVLVTITGQFDQPLWDGSSEQGEMRTLSADIRVASRDARLADILMSFKSKVLIAVYDPPYRLDPSRFCFGPVKRLCVQPVGIKESETDPSPTGTALPALMAEAEEMWERACVRFDVRDFVYVVNPDWKTLSGNTDGTTSAEESDLMDSVDTDDCVEIFFVEAWDPEGVHGGGATWSSGTAAAKIITSDENDNGIDFHHLAHELGHALNLAHPGDGDPGSLVDGSEGTVMCPSGWLRDNPDVQSAENADNASNPLLTFPLEFCCKDTDCTDSADCGPCPPLPPPPQSFTLTITKVSGSGSGTVTSAPAGINCGINCSQTYTDGTVVTLIPTPASGSAFSGWVGGDPDCQDDVVTMNANKTCVARFENSRL